MKSCLVIGLGRFGLAVAEDLCRNGVKVLGVDSDLERMHQAEGLLTHVVCADIRDESVLRSLGAADFECAVVAIGENIQSSIMVTIMLKELGIKTVIAKAQSQLHMKVLEKVGADLVLQPEYEMGRRLAQKLCSGNVLDYIELSEDYGIVERRVPRDWVGKSLIDLHVRRNFGINIIAIRDGANRERMSITPGADYRLRADDILIMIGANAAIERIK